MSFLSMEIWEETNIKANLIWWVIWVFCLLPVCDIPCLVSFTHLFPFIHHFYLSLPLFSQPLYPVCVCWQLYKELSQCYQALVSSEANLRQSHLELSSQLAQKDQHIQQLKAQLQQQHEQLQQQQQQQAQQTAVCAPPNRQTNFKVSSFLHPSSSPDRGLIRRGPSLPNGLKDNSTLKHINTVLKTLDCWFYISFPMEFCCLMFRLFLQLTGHWVMFTAQQQWHLIGKKSKTNRKQKLWLSVFSVNP